MFLEKVSKYTDEGHPTDILYLDLSKALDKVPHVRLTTKGVTGLVAEWIQGWLHVRKQSGGDWADPCLETCSKRHTSGVCLRACPIYSILYIIDDIDNKVCCEILKAADDTKLFRRTASVVNAVCLQEALTNIFAWSNDWQMLFNPERCVCVHAGYGNPKYDYYMGDTVTDSVQLEKDHWCCG